ncbi:MULTISPECIES: DUF3791 domain-containing protein [unclassified Fibrobacter]|uniref:DUF3791 domain-containing protein n=1 Tax=unclassified Fibrobacter TaxID=2634177 RepID=UPI00091CDEBF|nr:MULTISPECIES: DUF3791 domain-containing protein [unclassified Fibrobacter]OWV05286.1 DUF3791 domain-containing protein [Fibrobacter sp. UWH3]SHL30133.1 Protein of unknown function [Fibrobacter sp. UWH6]
MNENVLWRKMGRVIMQLADQLKISPKQALLLFYNSEVGKMMHDPKYGYELMSDTYIVNDIIAELRG